MATDELLSRLDEYGYVIVGLLNSEEVAYLHDLCDRFLQQANSGFISSSHILDQKDSDFINAELHRIVGPSFSKFFPGLQLLGGTLATKQKSIDNVSAHQDWSIVDENKFHSYNLWLPLVDTGKENGTLGLIPGSHRWSQQPRGLNIPNPFEKFTAKFLEIGQEPPLKAGQAILYDHRLLHYSRPNSTGRKRHTAIIGVKDKEAALRVSFAVSNDTVETYAVDEAAFYKFDMDSVRSSYAKLNTVKLPAREYSWAGIITLYNNHLPQSLPRVSLSLAERWLSRLMS